MVPRTGRSCTRTVKAAERLTSPRVTEGAEWCETVEMSASTWNSCERRIQQPERSRASRLSPRLLFAIPLATIAACPRLAGTVNRLVGAGITVARPGVGDSRRTRWYRANAWTVQVLDPQGRACSALAVPRAGR